jgi:hypothetical protein
MADESILGLLLRAYGKVHEQKHGEEYLHHNDNAVTSYRDASKHIYDAINAVVIAEMYVRRQEAHKRGKEEGRKELAKEMEPNGL